MLTVKNIMTRYGCLIPKNNAEPKPWDTVHVDLICPYIKSIRQQHLVGTTTNSDASITYMTMIKPTTGWFEFLKFRRLTLMR